MTTQRNLRRYIRGVLRGYSEQITSIWDAAEHGHIHWQNQFPARIVRTRQETDEAIWRLVGPLAEMSLSDTEQQSLRVKMSDVLDKYHDKVDTIWDAFERGYIHTQQEYDAGLAESLDAADADMWAILGPAVGTELP